MKEFLKEIRYPITALFALTLLTVLTLTERQRLQLGAARIETLTLAHLVLDLKREDVTLLIDSTSSSPNSRLDSGQIKLIQQRFQSSKPDVDESVIGFLNRFSEH